MKVFLILAIFSIAPVFAVTVNSQSIQLKGQELTVREAFREIENQSEYSFFYNADFSNLNTRVRLRELETDIHGAMGTILESTNLTYRIIDDNLIVITPMQAKDKHVVSGRVISSLDRVTIPGVTVSIKGTTRGTVTDPDGRYTIEAEPTDVLVFSFVGMTTTEISINGRSRIDIELDEQVSRLDEVVVVGYGTSKVRDVTGSIARVSEQDMIKAPMGSTVQSILQGRAAGVNVMIQSASPTSPISVIIRGQSSLTGNNQPLWVIDGVPDYSDGTSGNLANTLHNLNLNDVQSIDILKDASATAVYGSRAANGVVIVTTKSGRENMTPVIEFSTRFGQQRMDFNGYQYFEAPEFQQWADLTSRETVELTGAFDWYTRMFLDEQAFMNLNNSEFDASDLVNLPNAYYDSNTNWQNLMTQNPWTRQVDLSLRGGAPNIAYFVSLFNNQQDGIVKTGNSEVFGGRLRLETKLGQSLKFGLNMSGSTRKTNDKDYMLSVLKRIRPDVPVYDEDGSLFTRDPWTENPYTTLNNTRAGDGVNFNGTGFLEYAIIDGLFVRSSYTSNYVDNEFLNYSWRGTMNVADGARQWSSSTVSTMVWENTVNFARTFGKHDLVALAGYSREQTEATAYSMNATNFPDDEMLNNFSSATAIGGIGETVQAHSLVSQFARAHYKYNERYIVSGTLRRDGSSRFGPESRWGIFPSVAGAWLITEENFMKTSEIRKYITYLKLRASTGRAGSQNLGNYAWRTNVGAARYNESSAIIPISIGNVALRWEQTTMTDVGIDFGLLDERLRGSFGVYRKLSEDVIYSNPLPPNSAFATIPANIASTQNDGLEFEIRYDLIRKNNLLLTLDFNVASNNTKVLKINNATNEIFDGMMKLEEGGRTGQWFGWKYAGRLYVTNEEIVAMQTQRPTGAVQTIRHMNEAVGDLIFMDMDGDGRITLDDRVYLGSAEPKAFGGFGASMIFKNIMVSTIFSYAYGHKRLWQLPQSDAGFGGNLNQSNLIAGQSPSIVGVHNATMPRIYAGFGQGSNNLMNDFWLHDASYIRLNALNLSYRLPERFFSNMLVDAIEFTFQATNLFTITKYPGFDPQGNWSSTSIGSGMGVDTSSYPSSRTFNFGLKATLK